MNEVNGKSLIGRLGLLDEINNTSPAKASIMNWKCAFCGTRQKVYIGDQEDITKPDVEVVRCYSCKKLELACEDELVFRSDHCLWDEETDEPIPITQEIMQEHGYIEEGIPITK